jgi:PhzF family phenazine biosynthesis protein
MIKNIVYQVDSFTSEPFKGNPAGVCFLNQQIDEIRMQQIAAEMNLSETAFVFADGDGYEIRYFTPSMEVKLCGHATLATSHLLYESGRVSADQQIKFLSKAGPLVASKRSRQIVMDFPAYKLEKVNIPEDFYKATNLAPVELFRSNYDWHLLHMSRPEDVLNAVPNMQKIKESRFGNLILTAAAGESAQEDFVVRCFAPASDIPEDPVTGSAHCALTPFWAMKTGKQSFISHQVSQRGGWLNVRMLENNRVEIAGQAVTIYKAEFIV